MSTVVDIKINYLEDKFSEEAYNFIHEFYDNELTIRGSVNLYNNNVNMLEQLYNKYCYKFNSDQMIELFQSIPTKSISKMNVLYSFINKYIEWAISKDKINNGNVLDKLNKDELLKINIKALRKSHYDLDTIYSLCRVAESKGVSYEDIMTVLLARYGILGKQSIDILNLHISDVDRENCEITIIDREDGKEELINIVNVDREFIRWFDKCVQNPTTRKTMDVNSPYLIKRSKKNSDKPSQSNLYRRVSRVFEANGLKRPAMADLVNSRKIDDIKDIEKERAMTTDDYIKITKRYNPESGNSSYHALKKLYETYNECLVDKE